MLLTLSEYKPTWQDRVAPPGLTHTPRSDKAELAFNPRAVETFLPHTKALREFLNNYDESKQKDQMKYEDCGDEPADYKNRGDLDSDVGVRKACRFPRALLGPCSGLEDTEFGFKEGKPCLIVKLNRIVNYRPRPPTSNESIPEEAQPKVQPNVIPIYCTSKRRTLIRSERLSTTASVKGSPCSITPITARSCTRSTCSRWWRCSSPT
ncbi:unnamed protein product [Oreochromis niloticus]|nr:unnamed protein product [Mustela putorius furo]